MISSERMYKGRIKKWNIHRNSKLADMVAIARVLQEHGLDNKSGKKCEIEKDGKPFDMIRFWNYLRKKKWKLDDILREPSTSISKIVLKRVGTGPLTPDTQDWDQSSRDSTDGPSPLFSIGMSRKSSNVTEVDGIQQANLEEPQFQSSPPVDEMKSFDETEKKLCGRQDNMPSKETAIVTSAPQPGFTVAFPSTDRMSLAQDIFNAKSTSVPLGLETFVSSMIFDENYRDYTTEPFQHQLNIFREMSLSPAYVATIDTKPIGQDLGPNVVENSDFKSTMWIARCFLANILLNKEQIMEAKCEIEKTSAIFEGLVRRDDSTILTSIFLVHTVLACRDGNPLAERIIKDAHSAAVRASGRESVIAQILACIVDMYFTSSSTIDQQSETHQTSSDDLPMFVTACENLRKKYGRKHPHVITAEYWSAWRLTQENIEEKTAHEEALERLDGLIDIAEEVLSPCHVQTTAILVIRARILLSLDRPQDAVHTINEAIDRIKQRFDQRHPLRLEARRRQAVFLQQITRDQLKEINLAESIEEILFEVAAGRKAVLGPGHPFTKRSIANLRTYLEKEDQMARFNELLARLAGAQGSFSYEAFVY